MMASLSPSSSTKVEWDWHFSTSSCLLSCSSPLDVALIPDLNKNGACEDGFERKGSYGMLSCASLPEDHGCYTTAENELSDGFLSSSSSIASSTYFRARPPDSTTCSSGSVRPPTEQPALPLDVLDSNEHLHCSDHTSIPSTIWLKHQQHTPETQICNSAQNVISSPSSYSNQLQRRNSSSSGAPTSFTAAATNNLSNMEWTPLDSMESRDRKWLPEKSKFLQSTPPRADSNTIPCNKLLVEPSMISTASLVVQQKLQLTRERPHKDNIQLTLPGLKDDRMTGFRESSSASNAIVTTSSSPPPPGSNIHTTSNHGNSITLFGVQQSFCTSEALPSLHGYTTQCGITQQLQEVPLNYAKVGLGMANVESCSNQPTAQLFPNQQHATLAHFVLSMAISKEEKALQMILDRGSSNQTLATNKAAAAAANSDSCTIRQATSDHCHQQILPQVGACLHQSCSTTTVPHDQDILLGRGHGVNQHPGNLLFRAFIAQFRPLYLKTPKTEQKTYITHMLVSMCKAPFMYKGKWVVSRFLQFNKDKRLWVEVPDELARRKIAHLLRSRGDCRGSSLPFESVRNLTWQNH